MTFTYYDATSKLWNWYAVDSKSGWTVYYKSHGLSVNFRGGHTDGTHFSIEPTPINNTKLDTKAAEHLVITQAELERSWKNFNETQDDEKIPEHHAQDIESFQKLVSYCLLGVMRAVEARNQIDATLDHSAPIESTIQFIK